MATMNTIPHLRIAGTGFPSAEYVVPRPAAPIRELEGARWDREPADLVLNNGNIATQDDSSELSRFPAAAVPGGNGIAFTPGNCLAARCLERREEFFVQSCTAGIVEEQRRRK